MIHKHFVNVKCINIICLLTDHQRAPYEKLDSKVSVHSRSNGNVGFCGGRKTGEPGEKPSEQGREPTTNYEKKEGKRRRCGNPLLSQGVNFPLDNTCEILFLQFSGNFACSRTTAPKGGLRYQSKNQTNSDVFKENGL